MKTRIAVILIFTAIGVGIGGWVWGRNSLKKAGINRQTATNTDAGPTQTVGGDRDEHGCIGSAGYSWCELKQKCLRVWEEACATNTDETDLKQQIKAAIVNKHGVVASEMVISVQNVERDYARGSANVPTSGGGGGVWFAAKVNGTWQLVWDGNGIILCSDLNAYPDFPADMIPECYDDRTGVMVQR